MVLLWTGLLSLKKMKLPSLRLKKKLKNVTDFIQDFEVNLVWGDFIFDFEKRKENIYQY